MFFYKLKVTNHFYTYMVISFVHLKFWPRFFFESVVLLSSWAAPLFFSESGRAIKSVSSCHWSIGADRHSAPFDRTGELKRSCTTGLDNGNTGPNSQLTSSGSRIKVCKHCFAASLFSFFLQNRNTPRTAHTHPTHRRVSCLTHCDFYRVL